MKAILYARWSTLEQKKGSTLQRQTENGEAFCKAKKWAIVSRLSDSGLSAYTGDNLRSGELGKLTDRLEREGGDGFVIVVEKLDRLSRQPPLVMLNWVQRVCGAGAAVASADGKHMITQAALAADLPGMIMIIMDAFVGFKESKNKSDHGLENWRLKRESGKPLTKLCPAWLRLSDDRSQYVVIPERAEIVARIFRLQDEGVGKHTIAAMLNAEGAEPWGRGKRWHASYIQKIIRNAAVLGDHQHGQKQRQDAKRRMTGEIIKNYFPAVIDEGLFARVNDKRKQRVIAEQRRGGIANLFTGLARCSCGSIMTFRAKGAATRADGRTVREDYLVCDAAIRPGTKGGCPHRISYNYGRFRDAVLDRLLHRALDDQFFRAPDSLSGLEADVAAKTRQVADIDRRMAAAFQMVEEDADDAHARTRYRTLKLDLRAAQDALQAAQGALSEARGAVTPAEHLARVADVRTMMDSDDDATRNEARARVKLALNELISRCEFDASRQRAAVHIIGGAGVLFVERDGSAAWFDLAKPGRDYSHLDAEGQAAIAGYLRRSKAA